MKTIRFYGRDKQPFGDATLDDEGEIHYGNDRVEGIMWSSVAARGVAWAWNRFSHWSTGYAYSAPVED